MKKKSIITNSEYLYLYFYLIKNVLIKSPPTKDHEEALRSFESAGFKFATYTSTWDYDEFLTQLHGLWLFRINLKKDEKIKELSNEYRVKRILYHEEKKPLRLNADEFLNQIPKKKREQIIEMITSPDKSIRLMGANYAYHNYYEVIDIRDGYEPYKKAIKETIKDIEKDSHRLDKYYNF